MKSAAHPGSPRRPARIQAGECVLLAHGGGGQLTDALVGESILPPRGNLALNDLLDSGIISQPDGPRRP